jgi:hypothetical protein
MRVARAFRNPQGARAYRRGVFPLDPLGVAFMRRGRGERVALAVFASMLGALLVYAGPPGTDFAEHVYQEQLYAAHGFSLWNNLWYSGRYSFVTYSLLYYPLAGLVGIRALAVACAVVGVLAFDALVVRRWGEPARRASVGMAIVLPAFVLTAAFPFLLGLALGLLALLAASGRRWPVFAALCVLVAAASPLAFALLGVIVVGLAVGDRWERAALGRALTALTAVGIGLAMLARLFATPSHDPFPLRPYVAVVACCAGLAALTWRVRDARALHVGALVYAAVCTIAFVVTSNVGEGITRLQYVALPVALLALGLRRWRPRPLAAIGVLVAGYWNLAPLVASFAIGVADPTADARFWQPAVAYLHAHLTPAYRVEAVDTRHHWAAVYLPAAGVPLVRGWFRQDDFPQNAALYAPLTAAGYLTWLRSLGVGYVVLTDAAADYSALGEVALLRSGRSSLVPVFRSQGLEILRVPSPRPIVAGARVLDFGRDRIVLRLRRPGRYRIAVRSSPYWSASSGCLRTTPDGLLELSARRAGRVRLTFELSLSRVLDAAVGEAPESCAPALVSPPR